MGGGGGGGGGGDGYRLAHGLCYFVLLVSVCRNVLFSSALAFVHMFPSNELMAVRRNAALYVYCWLFRLDCVCC